MAKKSSESTKDAAPKTAAPKAAVKKTAVKKTAAPKAETASKSSTPKAAPKKAAAPAAPKAAAPKAAAPKAAAPKKAAPKKAPAIKLSDSMVGILNKIKGAGETGYVGDKKEAKTIESLATKKLIKKGAKDKKTGTIPYSLTKLGEKHLSTPAPEKSPAGA